MDRNQFLLIPGGSTQLGMAPEEVAALQQRSGEEVLAAGLRAVHVDPFFIQVFPVSVGDYVRFLQDTSRRPPACDIEEMDYERPVTGVTWFDALAFAKWSKARLPTADEWEYAARGTDARQYPWGRAEHELLRVRSRLPKIGALKMPSSPFGIRDTLGVVDEWTSTRSDGLVVVKGVPFSMRGFHLGRHFLLKPRQRWFCTGFRCARSLKIGQG